MRRIDPIVRDEKAQLWINHDSLQTATIAHSPSYFTDALSRPKP
jgi:N-acyl homoserine lactone hydrolase